MKNIAVILAGGKGTRAGEGQPKQFRTLADGRTVFETCVSAFEQNERIDEIAIVMLKDHMQQAQAIAAQCGWQKVHYWIAGGQERWESSQNAIKTLVQAMKEQGEDDCNVLIHDCARPFISQALITKVCKALKAYRAVSVALPATDTIYMIQPDGRGDVITDIPPRFLLRAAQTPQAFRLSVLAKAAKKQKTPVIQHFTDDAGMVFCQLPNELIYVVEGEPSNRKLTFAEDFQVG